MPVISVIVPTYNRAMYLPDCLGAILAQTVPPGEIIVVNDGSTDGTREVLETYRERVKVIHKVNGGKPSALNVGLAQATGEYIWIFDDDDIALPHSLKTHMEAFTREPEAGFTYSGYHNGVDSGTGNGLRITETFEAFRGPAKNLFLAFAIGVSGPGVGFMCQNGMLVRRTAYDAVGPFDETLTSSEDLDMDLRLCRELRGVRVNRPTFIRRLHSGLRGPNDSRYSFSERELRLRGTGQQVIRKLYDTTPLIRFCEDTVSITGWQGEALVTRARIMANWRLYDHVSQDLDVLKRMVAQGECELNEAVVYRLLLLEALCGELSKWTEARKVRRILKDLLLFDDGNGIWRRFVVRHHYWRGWERYREEGWIALARGIVKAGTILGPAGWWSLLRQRGTVRQGMAR